MKVLVIVLFITFITIMIFSIVVGALENRKKKKNVAEFLSKCDEKQLAFINEYDKCYKVGLRELCQRKKPKE